MRGLAAGLRNAVSGAGTSQILLYFAFFISKTCVDLRFCIGTSSKYSCTCAKATNRAFVHLCLVSIASIPLFEWSSPSGNLPSASVPA